jgi:phosphatidylglycerol:prolipoprotein diacylglycerol transferase
MQPPNAFAALLATPSAWLYALGYLTGAAAFAWMARRRGLGTAGVWSVSLVGLIGGLVGANLAQLLAGGGTVGKTVIGGVAGGYLSVFAYKRFLGLRRPLGDLFAVALMAGEAVGRWGCFVGGCCYGRPVAEGHFPAVFQHDAWRHPAQLYLSAACAAILAVLVALERRRALPENGLFLVQGVLYCAARFTVEFYRTASPVALGLTAAQWACVTGFVFFAARLGAMLAALRRAAPAGAAVPAATAAG